MENQTGQIPKKIAKKKKKILRSAIRLFKEDGYYNVSIENIVKASDSSTGSFYNYFGSKDELVISYRRELLNSCRKFFRFLNTDATCADKSSLDKLKALTIYILELLTDLGEEFGRVFTARRLKETDAIPEDKPYLDMITELVEAGQQDKSIRNDYTVCDITNILDFFIIGCHIDWQIKRGIYNMPQREASALDMLFSNISSDAAENKPKQMYFSELWADAISRTTHDYRSDIKNLEDQWLERLYGSKRY